MRGSYIDVVAVVVVVVVAVVDSVSSEKYQIYGKNGKLLGFVDPTFGRVTFIDICNCNCGLFC